jgi:hemerythrin-like domain-containing protein
MNVDEGRAPFPQDAEGAATKERPLGPHLAIERLVREHDNIAQLLVVLDSQFASIARGDDEAEDDLIRDAMTYMTDFVDNFHHGKEDYAVASVVDRVEGFRPLGDELNGQHRRIRETGLALNAELERMLLDEPVRRRELATIGFDYTAQVRRNMEFEEARVFPRLILMEEFDEEACARIDARLGSPPDPLFGPAVHARYRALFQTLTRRIGIDTEWP